MELAFGATPFGLYGAKFGGPIGSSLAAILYWLVMTSLFYKTFSTPRESIVYPLIFILLFVLGSLGGVVFLSGI